MSCRTLPPILVLLLWPLVSPAAAQSDQLPSVRGLVGSTVESSDGHLAGSVDGISGMDHGDEKLVLGLAGYLGVGEKDVAITAAGIERLPDAKKLPRHFDLGVYGGGALVRIKVPLTIKQLIEAAPFMVEGAGTGFPSSHVGTPTETKDKTPSSTQSGGPG